jgi:hypothetical protein
MTLSPLDKLNSCFGSTTCDQSGRALVCALCQSKSRLLISVAEKLELVFLKSFALSNTFYSENELSSFSPNTNPPHLSGSPGTSPKILSE